MWSDGSTESRPNSIAWGSSDLNYLWLCEESFGFFQNKIDLGEGFIAYVLPTNLAIFVYQVSAVERRVFEIVEGTVFFEDIELIIRQ